MKKIVILSTIAVIFIGVLINKTMEKQDRVKSGEIKIECNLNGYYKTIDPNKINHYDFQRGNAEFTNGYSRNCRVVK